MSWPGHWRIELAHLLALILPLGMLAVRHGLPVSFGEGPLLILFMLPVIVSALLGGFGPGLLATAAVGGITAYLTVPAHNFGIAAGHDLVQWGVLLGNGVLVSLMSAFLFRARREAASAQHRLRQSETNLDVIFEQAAVGIARVALDGHFLRVNRKFREILGYTGAELTTLRFQDVTHPHDLSADQDYIRRLHAGEIPALSREKRFIRKDGAAVQTQIHITAVHKPDGIPDYRIGVIEDIDARKRAEVALRQSQAQLTEARRMARFGSWTWDHVADAAVWSDEMYHILGRDPTLGAVNFQGVSQHFSPETWPGVKTAIEQTLATGLALECEAEVVRPDRSRHWITLCGEPTRDSAGDLVGLHDTVRDITVRRQAEMDLRESESRYRFLVEQFLAGIYIIQDGRFRYVNPGFAAIFRYGSPGELIERVSFTELVAPEDRERVAENIRRRVAGEISDMHYMFKVLRGDGSPFDVEVHGRAFEYQGRPAVIGMLLDITERKLAEAALAEREAGYRAVIETAADGFWIADDQGRLLAVNDAYVRRSG